MKTNDRTVKFDQLYGKVIPCNISTPLLAHTRCKFCGLIPSNFSCWVNSYYYKELARTYHLQTNISLYFSRNLEYFIKIKRFKLSKLSFTPHSYQNPRFFKGGRSDDTESYGMVGVMFCSNHCTYWKIENCESVDKPEILNRKTSILK